MARSPLSLFGTICALFSLSDAAADWVSLSLTGPNGISDLKSYHYYANNVLVGTPPATESLFLDLISSVLAVSSENCVFCPGTDFFDPSLSSTYHMTHSSWSTNSTDLGGVLAQDTVSFGGVLTSQNTPFSLIERMSQNFTERILDGHLGLYVDPSNETSRDQHILTLLNNAGQLINPVVGLRLGNDLNTSRITIGALDPNDYEGTINWVEAETPDKSWDAPVVIQIDGLRGANGSFLPYPNPLLTYLDNTNMNIHVPNVWTYMSTDNYTGPVDTININGDGTYGFICNNTVGAYAPLSVDINGVSYQIDSQDNLLRNNSGFSAEGFCNVGLLNLTTTASIPSVLGLPFFRSVYLAYRFPTTDCPTAHYGFAFPKGSNRTSSMIAQQPRSTPSASAQCLSLATPTSTPTVVTPAPQASSVGQGLSEGSYSVLNSPDISQVRLKGVDELKAGLVQGPKGDN